MRKREGRVIIKQERETDQRQTVKPLRHREKVNEDEGNPVERSNPALQGEVVFRFCSWPPSCNEAQITTRPQTLTCAKSINARAGKAGDCTRRISSSLKHIALSQNN